MLGPIKILVPFVNMSRKADSSFRRRLATRAVLFSAAALAIAVLLGRSMLENFEISVPVLAMTGGIVLFLVALRTVLQQSSGSVERPKEDDQPADLSHALTPLAFPIVVTPYGVAAVIVCDPSGAVQFPVCSGRNCRPDLAARLVGDAVCRVDIEVGRNLPSGVRSCSRCYPDCPRLAGNPAQSVHGIAGCHN
nr:MarC family protein [Mesorhizobium soli]